MTTLIYHYRSPKGFAKSKNISNSSRLILEEAERYGISSEIIPGTEIITLTLAGNTQYFHHQVPTATTALARFACTNKRITSNLLMQAGVNVPKGFRIKKSDSDDTLREIYRSLQKPLVVKPTAGTWGENITVNVRTYQEFLKAVDVALQYTSENNTTAVVEEMFQGTEYRILVTRQKVIGVLHRRPANVVGDGQSTIQELIKQKNTEPIRGPKGSTCSHLRIRIDQRLREYLHEQQLALDTVLLAGEQVFLRRVSNISQGGEAIDYTDLIHPSVAKIALAAINAVPGLELAGIDFMTTDVTAPQTKESYVIIEVNESPGIDIHDQPYQGKNRHAAREFIFLLFPELRDRKKQKDR